MKGELEEFRLLHPTLGAEKVFAMEFKGTSFFPLQDFRFNLCALQKANGSLAEWTRYSAFGEKQIYQAESHSFFSPWHFANRREIEGLVLFTHRLYYPGLMRWLTPDPVGFIDGLNLYAYVHNNPFYYQDKDGQIAQAIPIVVTLVEFSWGATVAAAPILLPAIGCTIGTALIAYGVYELAVYAQGKFNDTPDCEESEKINEQNQQPPLVEPKTKKEKESESKTKKEERNGAINNNPFTGSVSNDVILVDEHGNAIPVKTGQYVTGSQNGEWLQVRDDRGNPTGLRKDGAHSPQTHKDPRALQPHAHIPEINNADGTPWMPINH